MATRPPRRRPPARRPRARRRRSDLPGRLVVAVPAIAFAIFIVTQGGWVFALGLWALGCFCLHELYVLLEADRPVKLAGFLGLTALIAVALAGGADAQFEILLAQMALVPVVFGLALAAPRRSPVSNSMAAKLLPMW